LILVVKLLLLILLHMHSIMTPVCESWKAASGSDLRLPSKMHNKFAGGYFAFTLCFVLVVRLFSDGDYSGIYTLGVATQCLGFYQLLTKVEKTRSVAGISAKTLHLYVMVFCFRLCSTLIRNGYLPIDRSGDFVFQAADMVSLAMAIRLLRSIRGTHRSTYQEEYDTMPYVRMIPPCLLLAVFCHGNLNRSPVFDVIWTVSMNLDTIAMVPQLWMLAKIGGEVEGMTSHFVAALAFSRACAFSFWFYGYNELAPKGKDASPNWAGYQLITAHAMQVLLSLDFLYYYLVARVKGKRMQLPTVEL